MAGKICALARYSFGRIINFFDSARFYRRFVSHKFRYVCGCQFRTPILYQHRRAHFADSAYGGVHPRLKKPSQTRLAHALLFGIDQCDLFSAFLFQSRRDDMVACRGLHRILYFVPS